MSCLERSERLLGAAAMERLKGALVVVVGIGGVGGHCAEALARSGVGRLLLIDGDRVAESNLNRQLFADKASIGLPKVEAAIKRLNAVSDCVVTGSFTRLTRENVNLLLPADADFLVDAIDDLDGKLTLALWAKEHTIPCVACLGAGRRLDATAFRVTDVFKTQGDPLARRFRQLLRQNGVDKLTVVASTELPKPSSEGGIGSLAPVTGAAGLAAAGCVLERLTRDARANSDG